MNVARSRRSMLRSGVIAGVSFLLGVTGVKQRTVRIAKANGTWTLWSPKSSFCASDYVGHADNALDFGGTSGEWVYLHFDAGPLKGAAKITQIINSCSTALIDGSHRKIIFELYKDDGVSVVGSGVAEHVVPQVALNQWVWGGGGGFCTLGGGYISCAGDPPPAACRCWTGPHVHYGASGAKIPQWVGLGCQSVQAGKTACWSFWA